MSTPLFALTTRGLEPVSKREMESLPGLTTQHEGYRRIEARYEGSLNRLLALRTVDDVYLSLQTWGAVSHTRDMLAQFTESASRLDVKNALALLRGVRPIPQSPTFSVTASFVGKRNYTSDEIKQAVANGISQQQGWIYTPDDRAADLNIRVFIEHEVAYVGVRLGKHPLHERPYKVAQRAGSLKPSVAAAMLQLAHLQPGQRLLDPCCGAGTILIEGALMGATGVGGDIAADAVKAAQTNAGEAEIQLQVEQWDARKLPITTHSIDRVVSNLPWGRQIEVNTELADFYRDTCAEIERVVSPGGRVVILTSAPHLLVFENLQPREATEISLFGQRPIISVFDRA